MASDYGVHGLLALNIGIGAGSVTVRDGTRDRAGRWGSLARIVCGQVVRHYAVVGSARPSHTANDAHDEGR